MDNMKLMVPCKPEYVSTIRLAISSLANNAGFDIEAIEDIKVAVSEACSNIVAHSSSGENTQYEVDCSVEKGRIELCVKDYGTGFNLEEYSEPNLDIPSESGLGVFLIRVLMDDVIIESKEGLGTCIKMVKSVKAV